MPEHALIVWRRIAESRRLLVIEHMDGSIEECGFVTVLHLHRTQGSEVRRAIEWKDADGIPHTGLLSPDEFDEDGKLLGSHAVDTGRGFQMWHFDEEALAKMRRSA